MFWNKLTVATFKTNIINRMGHLFLAILLLFVMSKEVYIQDHTNTHNHGPMCGGFPLKRKLFVVSLLFFLFNEFCFERRKNYENVKFFLPCACELLCVPHDVL